jgi:hypothetical protein
MQWQLFIATTLFITSCVTAEKPVATNRPAKPVAGKVAKQPNQEKSLAAKPGLSAEQEKSLSIVRESPKGAATFVANADLGRSGVFRNLITVFVSDKGGCPECRELRIVYDGKTKDPSPSANTPTNYVQVDLTGACAAAKAPSKPLKLRNIWNVYNSPTEARAALKLSECRPDGLVTFTTMGLRCTHIGLPICSQLQEREKITVPFAELTKLATVPYDSYPNKIMEGVNPLAREDSGAH